MSCLICGVRVADVRDCYQRKCPHRVTPAEASAMTKRMTPPPEGRMPDHTEREREARRRMCERLTRYAEIEHPNRDHPAIAWKFECDVQENEADLDAYTVVVRAAVLAEVREKVEAQDTFALDRGRGYGCGCEMKREPDADWLDRTEVLDALVALEATDGR